MGNRGVK